jgi:hypothetical protein
MDYSFFQLLSDKIEQAKGEKSPLEATHQAVGLHQ